MWVVTWLLDGPTQSLQHKNLNLCFLKWFGVRKVRPKSEIVSYPYAVQTHLLVVALMLLAGWDLNTEIVDVRKYKKAMLEKARTPWVIYY